MVHAIHIHTVGGPEQLSWDEIEVGAPGAGEARIRQRAAGLNFSDVYHGTGLYPLPSLPATFVRRRLDAVVSDALTGRGSRCRAGSPAP